MLRLLAVILILFLLFNPVSARAGFFEEEDTPARKSACSECESESLVLNSDLKDKASVIEGMVLGSFNRKENTLGHEIVLFIDLADSLSDTAVNALVKFKKDNPVWSVRGVIAGNRKNLKEKLLQKQRFFSNGIDFSIDLSGSMAKESGIFKTPAYVIIHNGKHHKITGLFDLNDAISKLDK